MQRVGTILLAALAVIVLGAAVWVIRDNPKVPEAGTTPTIPSSMTSDPGAGSDTTSAHPSATSSGTNRTKLTIAFVGDDWTAGQGAAKAQRFTTLVCHQLHATEVNTGDPNSGYVAKGRDGTYSAQIAAVVKADPAVVVVSGGRNDDAYSIDTAGTAATSLFATLHKKLPHATLIAIGPFWGDSPLPPEMATLGDEVKKAVTSSGGTYLSIKDPIEGHPNYMANEADPNSAGYRAIAKAVEPALAEAVKNVKG